LAGALILTLVLATILSFAVALTVTRPLAAVTGAMRDVAATGDLTRKVRVHSGPWADADARLLASAFNTLTESIARFQAEAAQRERLSSLGRLSTVIAHEVRNPLMIIKAALRTLRRGALGRSDLREAVQDIEEETVRPNRIVTEVLDFAKPLRLSSRGQRQRHLPGVGRRRVGRRQDGRSHAHPNPSLPRIVTDRERLRIALVNILTNARTRPASRR
jgi:signal transduction histidine kinase